RFRAILSSSRLSRSRISASAVSSGVGSVALNSGSLGRDGDAYLFGCFLSAWSSIRPTSHFSIAFGVGGCGGFRVGTTNSGSLGIESPEGLLAGVFLGCGILLLGEPERFGKVRLYLVGREVLAPDGPPRLPLRQRLLHRLHGGGLHAGGLRDAEHVGPRHLLHERLREADAGNVEEPLRQPDGGAVVGVRAGAE